MTENLNILPYLHLIIEYSCIIIFHYLSSYPVDYHIIVNVIVSFLVKLHARHIRCIYTLATPSTPGCSLFESPSRATPHYGS